MTAERFNSALLFVLLSAMPSAVWAGQEAALRPASATAAKAPEVSPKPDAIRAKKSAGAGGSLDGREFRETRLGLSLLQNIARDQREIWTSPERLRFSDLQWLVPVGGFAAGLLVTDRDTSGRLSRNPQTIRRYNNVANAGVAGLIGVAGGLSLWSLRSHNAHWRETGYLAGEAAINSLLLVETAKYSLRRDRPFQGNGSGHFFQGGGTSFPSEHAAAAWSIAGVIAHEYPGPLTKLMAYGLASAVSFSRVRARQHFLSDVFIGGMIGNLVAQQVYSRHHDPELGGGEWRSIGEFFRGEGSATPANQGSPYVPLDSWVYPAFDRLAALGVIDSGFAGMRPWTRLECVHLVQDASDNVNEGEAGASEASGLVGALVSEFAEEWNAILGGSSDRIRLESVYSRMMDVSGKPLADSYHFGQTIINDYGRPFQEGFDDVLGFSGYATAGRFSIYVRGEYQHAPSAPAYSLPVRQAIANADANPLQPANPIATVNQFRLLDTYVGVNLKNWELTFGKQSLWWGPGKGGALLFSNNAEPIYMVRASRVTPFTLPWILHWLGPMKWDVFFGKLSGNQFPPRAVIHGEKISFKPTRNLELGFTRTAELGGVGRPLTFASIWNSYVSVTSSPNETPASDPGKRMGGFEFSYRVPFVRNWLTVYADSLSDDDPSPLAAPRRAGISPGIYMPRIPGLPKLDFRFEAVYTDTPTSRSNGGKYIYWDGFHHDLHTNKNNIIGSWIGREGQGFQGWSTYWFTPRNSLQLGYRHARISSDFIPGGGSLNDVSVRGDYWQRANFGFSASVQYERWLFPLIQPNVERNVTAAVEFWFQPQKLFRRTATNAAGTAFGNGGRP